MASGISKPSPTLRHRKNAIEDAKPVPILFNSVASEASGGVASISDRSIGLKQPARPCGQLLNSPCVYSRSMGNKPSRRRRRKSRLAVINVDESIVLGALVDNSVISVDSDPFGREFYAISTDLYWGLDALTVGEGPIVVGVAHNDYTDVEMAETLNQTGMEDPGDKIAQERGRRLVRRAGQFSGVASNQVLNDGKVLRTRIGFVLTDGFSLAFWAQNKSNSAPLTTGAAINVNGKIYGRWI